MATDYLDPNAYLRSHLTQDVAGRRPRAAGRVGHVHLQVGDIPTARAFYVDALGFEATVTRATRARCSPPRAATTTTSR